MNENEKSLISGLAGVAAEAFTGGVSLGALGVIATEMMNRALSKKQEKRVNDLNRLGRTLTQQKINNGDSIRNDGFFDQVDGQSSSAEEIFEGVFFVAMNSYQEKKIPHLAHLLTNIAFDESCKRHDADRFLRLAESLSFNQFVIMKLFYENENNKYGLKNSNYVSDTSTSDSTETILSLSYSLLNNGLIRLPSEGRIILITDARAITPSIMEISRAGERFYKLLSLDSIDDSEVLEIVNLLT